MSASKKEKKVPALVDKPMDFCPGCGHGIISRLIMECLDELNQNDNIIFPIGVGCSSNLGAGLECDRLHCSHGRAGAEYIRQPIEIIDLRAPQILDRLSCGVDGAAQLSRYDDLFDG